MPKNSTDIKNLFNEIASIYDATNNVISCGTHKIIKKLAINSYNFQGNVLDLCTGTGDIANLLKNKCNVIGLDFSQKMIAIAKEKYPDIKFLEGDCTNLPFKDNSFDAITISFGLRNIPDKNLALKEIYRVLKPKGILFHLDFDKSNTLTNFIFDNLVKLSTKLICKNNSPYIYLINSKKTFLNKNDLIKLFGNFKFKTIKNKNFMMGIISLLICEKI